MLQENSTPKLQELIHTIMMFLKMSLKCNFHFTFKFINHFIIPFRFKFKTRVQMEEFLRSVADSALVLPKAIGSRFKLYYLDLSTK